MQRRMLLAVLVVLGLGNPTWAETVPRVITVTGEGQVDAVPDMAVISLGVTHEAKEAKVAMTATSQDVARVLERLSAMGIEPRDLQTSRFSLNPVWDNRNSSTGQPPRITGFSASNAVTVRLRDMAALGSILDDVISEGANHFNGLQLSLQESKPLKDEARGLAVADAMERAALFAQAAGVTLGPVQSISENGGGGRPVMMEMSAMRHGGAPIAAGEVTVSASVTMVFLILE